MRQICSVENISSDSLELIEDINDIASGWTLETGAIADTNTPQIGKKNIPVYELFAQPKATQKLIDDSSIDIDPKPRSRRNEPRYLVHVAGAVAALRGESFEELAASTTRNAIGFFGLA